MNGVWEKIVGLLEQNYEKNRHGYWTNHDAIMCPTEEAANILADFLEDVGFDVVSTSYYDTLEDERDGDTNECTGWYAVYPD